MAESMEDVEPLVTRCPECGTRFRVTEVQLQMAGGRVRCGSCLTVFFGTDHLQWDLEQAAATSDPTETLDALLKEIDVFEAEDVARAAEDLIPPEPLIVPGADELDAGMSTATALQPAVDAADIAPWIEPEVASPEPVASESPELVPRDVATFEVAPEAEVRAGEEAKAEAEPRAETPEPAEAATVQAAEPAPLPEPVVEPAPDRFVRLWEEPPENRLDDAPEPTGVAVTEMALPAAGAASVALAEDDTPEMAAEPESAPAPRIAGRRRGRSRMRPQAAANRSVAASAGDGPAPPAPVETPVVLDLPVDGVADVPPTPRPRRLLRWLTLPLAALLITAQVVWYFFPSWAADPAMRWLPERICGIAGCELAPLRALDQLLITDVLLRTDPDRANLRIVNVLLVNTAPFDQAFPEVEVAFRAPTGDLVAWKRFHPNDYLSPEFRQRPIIPAKTPVRIELGIEDPGTQSYGYEISLK